MRQVVQLVLARLCISTRRAAAARHCVYLHISQHEHHQKKIVITRKKKNSTVVNIDCQTWIEYVGIVYR